MNKTTSDTIALLRPFLMIGPVLVHACLNPGGSSLQFLLSPVLGSVSVPMLFLLSGILFFSSYDGTLECWTAKLRRRIFTLVIPYIIWNIVAYVVLSLWLNLLAPGDFLNSFWAVRVGRRVGMAPADGPLYFVKTLMELAIVAPLFHLVRKYARWLAAVAVAAWIFAPDCISQRAIVLGSVFFMAGACLADNLPSAGNRTAWAALAVMVLLAAFSTAFMDSIPRYVIRLAIVAGIISTWSLAGLVTRFPAKNLTQRLGGLAMFIFCSFDIVMTILHRTVKEANYNDSLSCLCVAAATLVICTALHFAIRSISPAVSAVLTGSR